MSKIICGGFDLGDNLKMNGKALEVGSDNMTLSDAGLEVSTGAQGETMAIGCVEDENEELVNGIRGTDDIHIYAGTDDSVLIHNNILIGGNMLIGGTVHCDEIVIPSSTPGSTKEFKITVDDSGTITATEST